MALDDDGYLSESPATRSRIRKTEKERKRRHSSLQFDRSASGLEVTQDSKKPQIQIFKVFGVHLPLLLQRERTLMGINEKPRMSIMREENQTHHSIPHIVSLTVEYLKESDGYKAPGIFRQCGKHSELLKAQAQIDKGEMITKEQLEKLDPHTIGDLLKTFLRLLPFPLIPVQEFYAHFLHSTKLEERRQFIAYLGCLIQILPVDARAIIDYLCEFFYDIIEYSAENMMGASNLAIIFSPAFFGQSASTDSSRIIMETKATSKITQTLIENYPTIFKKKHQPMEILIAKESFQYQNFSVLKGEEVLWFMLSTTDEKGFLLVAGNLHYIEQIIVREKCRAKPLATYEDSLKIPHKPDDEAAREHALRILTGTAASSKPNMISNAIYIDAGSTAIGERERVLADVVAAVKSKKKGHLRRKSSEIFNLVVSRKESVVSQPEEEPDAEAKEKEKKEKEKKTKKEKAKKLTAWYTNSPATKSAGNLFSRTKSHTSVIADLKTNIGKKGKKEGSQIKMRKSKAQDRIAARKLNASAPLEGTLVPGPLPTRTFTSPAENAGAKKHRRRISVHFSDSHDVIT